MLRLLEMGTAEVTLLHVVETPWVYLGLTRAWQDYLDGNDLSVQLERE